MIITIIIIIIIIIINSLGWYIKHHIESLIVTVRISNTVPCENYTQPKEFKQQDNEERLNEVERESSFWAIR